MKTINNLCNLSVADCDNGNLPKQITGDSSFNNCGLIEANKLGGFEYGCAVELFMHQLPVLCSGFEGKVLAVDILSNLTRTKLAAKLLQFDLLVVSDDLLLRHHMFNACIAGLKLYHQAGGRIAFLGRGLLVAYHAQLLDQRPLPSIELKTNEMNKYTKLRFDDDLSFSLRERVYISGQGFKALRLALLLITQDKGKQVLTQIVNNMSFSPKLIETTLQKVANQSNQGDCRIRTVISWACDNLQQIDNIDQLAERAFLSRRSFDRQFRAVQGISAKDWLTQTRLSSAKEYLLSSNMNIEKIAALIGFGCATNFRNNFQRFYGYSPREYRRDNTVHIAEQ